MPAPSRPARQPAPVSALGPKLLVALAALMVLAILYAGRTANLQPTSALPPPVADMAPGAEGTRAVAVFAGGCFWGVQAVFQHTEGVLNAVSGYAGGSQQQATYPQVASGKTSHAEAVEVTYDPSRITYGQLLQVLFSVAHDPTEVNRQGPDIGPQYRSAIFATSVEQQRIAEQYVNQINAAQVLPRPVATTVQPLVAFYPAEPEHQDYATRNPHSIYIATYDRPKIALLQTLLPDRYRDRPLLVSDQASPAPEGTAASGTGKL